MGRALALDPGSVWANYYRGVCALRLGKPVRAVDAFSACAAQSGQTAWCLYNLGLAYTEAGAPADAVPVFDRALAADPGLAAAWLGRAAARLRAGGRPADALADVRRAADAGLPQAEVVYHTAMIYLAGNDRAAGKKYLEECLAHAPDHAKAREALARLRAGH